MFSEFAMPGVPVALFWVFAGLGVLIQGVSKSGFAGGAGILSLPLMMLVMPSDKVAAVLLPLLVLCDLNAIYFHRHNKVWRVVIAIYIPAVLGTIIGGTVWWYVGTQGIERYDYLIKCFVGITAIVFSFYIIGKESAMRWVEHIKTGPVLTWICGVTGGFFSTIAHAAGPIVGLYIFAQNLGKELFVGTTAWTFTFINLTKVPFYVATGLIRTDVLLFDLLLVWLIPIGSYAGKWFSGRVSERMFNRVICVLTLISGLQLIFNVKIIGAVFQFLFGWMLN